MIICTVKCFATDRIVFEYTKRDSDSCISIDTTEQQFFKDLVFVTLDTGCMHIDRGMVLPLRMAYDAEGRGYKLLHFDSMQFNEMIHDYPSVVSISDVWKYGQFFTEVTETQSLSPHLYIQNVDDFVEGRKQSLTEFDEVFPEAEWYEMERRIRSVCEGMTLDTIVFRPSLGAYEVNYYIWYSLSGKIRHYQLRIAVDGRCEVLFNKVIASEVADYFYYERK